ncbi:MAG: deoxyribodipyrimidine photo-lyase [Betaproteobacteria bacterium]
MGDMRYDRALIWFRRDLRAYDNAALYQALSRSKSTCCVFVFDTDILGRLPSIRHRRVEFIYESVRELRTNLRELGGDLFVLHGRARAEIPALAKRLKVQAVYANADYEPAAIDRDDAVEQALSKLGVQLHRCKDQVIFAPHEILTNGKPFSVFTPYKNAWLARLQSDSLAAYPVEQHASALSSERAPVSPSLAALGFERTNLAELRLPTGTSGGQRWLQDFLTRIDDYHELRNYPARNGPSYLSVHLRFGTLSIRELARLAHTRNTAGARVWLSELIWREFYFMIMFYHPGVVEHAFKPAFENVAYTNNDDLFKAWCEGRTGYPLIDAAMHQINQTGYMHNRLRMVTASFLTKDLHVDWRWGERYFAAKLNDYDLSANNGGWQWAASTGSDAQPYFRIFNPTLQSQRFDPDGNFVRLYLPALSAVPAEHIHAPWLMSVAAQKRYGVIIGKDYPAPIVDHAEAREKTLKLYGVAKQRQA